MVDISNTIFRVRFWGYMSSVLYCDEEPDHPDSSRLFIQESGDFSVETSTGIRFKVILQYRPRENMPSRVYSPSEELSRAVNPGGERGKHGRINRNGA